jgi:creatinine amidohydrolase
MTNSKPRPYVLLEATYRQLLDDPPNLAILPWGATEAHNYHLPHGTDVIEAERIAAEAARRAVERGAKPIVLPTIPFGNNAQQLDQVATIHFSTDTASSILNDVCLSLTEQGIDRLLIVNAHGGNEFKPLVRDKQLEFDMFVTVCNFWQVAPEVARDVFKAPGDHAGELETSVMLHLHPAWVQLAQAGPGERRALDIEALNMPGVWTPRPWSQIHPDTGDGDPAAATAAKGERYFTAVTAAVAELIVALSAAKRGSLPYI